MFVQDFVYLFFMEVKVDGFGGIYVEIIQEVDKWLLDYIIDLVFVFWLCVIFMIWEGYVVGFVGIYCKIFERLWIWYYFILFYEEEVFVFCWCGVVGVNWWYLDDYVGLVFVNNLGFGMLGSVFFVMVKVGEIDLIEE